MNLKEMDEEDKIGWRYATMQMKWHGWGSPVGLSIFFLALCVCGLIVRFAWLLH